MFFLFFFNYFNNFNVRTKRISREWSLLFVVHSCRQCAIWWSWIIRVISFQKWRTKRFPEWYRSSKDVKDSGVLFFFYHPFAVTSCSGNIYILLIFAGINAVYRNYDFFTIMYDLSRTNKKKQHHLGLSTHYNRSCTGRDILKKKKNKKNTLKTRT